MKAEIITIGDEILIGQIVDTNASWLGQELGKIGISVLRRSSVGDTHGQILASLEEAAARAELVVLTGGLGPTKDDITKAALCEYFQTSLLLDEKILEWVTNIFSSRKLPMTDTNKLQAMVPANCEVLFNRSGTAPGMWFPGGSCTFISLPGVPFEMQTIFNEEVRPRLLHRFELPVIVHRTIQTCSIGESFLAAKIRTLEDELPSHIRLAYLPSVGAVRLRLSGYGKDRAALEDEIGRYVRELYKLAGEYIFGEEDDTLEKVVGELLKGKTVSTAESCTGGYIAQLITSVPGSSAYYTGSIVCYDNRIKVSELGVSPQTLDIDGAVSEACVRQMAEGIRKKFGTDYSIATSGIAGPTGGSETKPVGTVWIAISSSKGTEAKKFQMGDHRGRTVQRSAIMALDLLRRTILEI